MVLRFITGLSRMSERFGKTITGIDVVGTAWTSHIVLAKKPVKWNEFAINS
jgi:hypothetical protein